MRKAQEARRGTHEASAVGSKLIKSKSSGVQKSEINVHRNHRNYRNHRAGNVKSINSRDQNVPRVKVLSANATPLRENNKGPKQKMALLSVVVDCWQTAPRKLAPQDVSWPNLQLMCETEIHSLVVVKDLAEGTLSCRLELCWTPLTKHR